MRRNRTAALLVAGSLLVGALGMPATAGAEPGPLYRLVDTAAQRLATADPVAAFKWVNDGPPIDDPPRAAAVLDAVGADATAHGIDPSYVRTVFTDQIDATEGIEYMRFAQWKFDPRAAPTTGPDLFGVTRGHRRLQQDDGRRNCPAMEFAARADVLD
jgi:chorismate mutase